MLIYLTIGRLHIPMYGLLITTGIVCANLSAFIVLKRYHQSIDDFILSECFALLGGLIGAKLLYLFVSRDQIDWSSFFEPSYFRSLMSGGFVFLGGLIGGLIGLAVLIRLEHVSLQFFFHRLSFIVPLAHGFGRLGCFCAGCCYGIPWSGRFSIIFPESSYAPAGIPLFPIQLVEAVLLFTLSFFLFIFYALPAKERNGFPVYLLTYCVIRFFLEFFRYDNAERGYIGYLSTSQFLSLILAAGMIVIHIFQRGKHRVHNIFSF